MENLRLEVPYSENITRKHFHFLFERQWAKALNSRKNGIIVGSVMVLFGGLVWYFKGGEAWLLWGLGLWYLANALGYHRAYGKAKKTLDAFITQEGIEIKKWGEPTIFEFKPEGLYVNTHSHESTIKWKTFTGCEVANDMLILHLNSPEILHYFISEDEIGSENFERVLTFIAEETDLKNKNQK